MDTNNVPETIEDIKRKNSMEELKLLYDFQIHVITESISNLVKGEPIYSTILAVPLAYFLLEIAPLKANNISYFLLWLHQSVL